jgi:aldehyde dehydrogenase (NAD+)
MKYKTDVSFRKESLKKLNSVIKKYEKEVIAALYADFKKPELEVLLTETGIVYSELKTTISNIHSWAKPKKVWPSLLNFPSSDFIYSEPYGDVLIIAPWNYPFQLAICPLIAAVAAGNKVTLKPSELSTNTAAVISKIISEVFGKDHVEVIEGGIEVSGQLLKQRWDYIFFTGSTTVGKIVAKSAAENLTPVTLELGGKNPCIVDETANLNLAAKRIIWGKMMNAGQTCIAPDYLLVHANVKEKLIALLQLEIQNAFGENPQQSNDFARIINHKNWKRQLNLLENHQIIYGGQSDEKSLYIAPTLVNEPNMESKLMKEEIFGPVLPIISYQTADDIKKCISKFEKPLSFYLFSKDKTFIKTILETYSFGGGCINDTVVHFGNKRLPFGGVGHSGMGSYHGKRSFDTFSHKKSILKKANWLDIPLRYAPYKNKLELLKKILNWL